MSYECPCPGGTVNTPDPDFKIEAVVVCDHYSDFLRCTLPANKHLFDRIVVVTSAEDRDTQRICEFHHVECLQTDALNSRWNKFCKGAGINEGLSRLDRHGWVVHLDADIGCRHRPVAAAEREPRPVHALWHRQVLRERLCAMGSFSRDACTAARMRCLRSLECVSPGHAASPAKTAEGISLSASFRCGIPAFLVFANTRSRIPMRDAVTWCLPRSGPGRSAL